MVDLRAERAGLGLGRIYTLTIECSDASGNVATEDVVYMLHGMGIETGIDLAALVSAGHFISDALGRPNASSVGRALRSPSNLGNTHGY